MIRRETDAELVNAIANHASVLPHFDLGGSGALDFTPCVEDADSYVFLTNGRDACGVFEWSAHGVWQCHTMFLPACRGRRAIDDAKAMVAWMFDDGAQMLWGETPHYYRAARWFNRQVGFLPAGIGHHPKLGEVERFVLRTPDGRTPDCCCGDQRSL